MFLFGRDLTGFETSPDTCTDSKSYSASISPSEKSFPKISNAAVFKSPLPEVKSTLLPSLMKRIDTPGFESAILSTTPATALASVTSFFRNFILAGVLKNKSLTTIVVPNGHPASSIRVCSPAFIQYLVPVSSSGVRVSTSTAETAATEARASPRKPSVTIALRSSLYLILLVAWLINAAGISSRLIPHPLSVTRI